MLLADRLSPVFIDVKANSSKKELLFRMVLVAHRLINQINTNAIHILLCLLYRK